MPEPDHGENIHAIRERPDRQRIRFYTVGSRHGTLAASRIRKSVDHLKKDAGHTAVTETLTLIQNIKCSKFTEFPNKRKNSSAVKRISIQQIKTRRVPVAPSLSANLRKLSLIGGIHSLSEAGRSSSSCPFSVRRPIICWASRWNYPVTAIVIT